MEILIGPEWLETNGSNSLLGRLATQSNGALPKELTIVFPQTSTRWKREHGGPDYWLLPEHSVPCLVADVINLISKGVKITTEMRDIK